MQQALHNGLFTGVAPRARRRCGEGGGGVMIGSDQRTAPVTALIAERYGVLSASHRLVADFILANPHEAALMTLRDIAGATGVSEATINRLGAKLGLAGHVALKDRLRSELKAALRPVEAFTAALQEEAATDRAPWTSSIEEDLQRISGIQAVGGDKAYAQASHLLATSRNVFLVGFGSSAFIAQYAAFCLSSLRDGCEALTDSSGVEGAVRKSLSAGPEDVALQIAFARYSEPAVGMAKRLHAAKVPIIGVTDSANAPILPFVSNAFMVERKTSFILSSPGAAAVAVIEALMRGAAAAIGFDAVSRRSARLTSLLEVSVISPADD